MNLLPKNEFLSPARGQDREFRELHPRHQGRQISVEKLILPNSAHKTPKINQINFKRYV